MASDLRLIETACIHCLYKPVFGAELEKSSSVAFNSQTTLPKLVFTDCWDLANPNNGQWGVNQLSPELQDIIKKYPIELAGIEEPDSASVEAEILTTESDAEKLD
jgi:hypothetical protein